MNNMYVENLRDIITNALQKYVTDELKRLYDRVAEMQVDYMRKEVNSLSGFATLSTPIYDAYCLQQDVDLAVEDWPSLKATFEYFKTCQQEVATGVRPSEDATWLAGEEMAKELRKRNIENFFHLVRRGKRGAPQMPPLGRSARSQ
jgi:hypothetical protein